MKKLQKDVLDFTGSSIILSAGGSVVTSLGGSGAGINAFGNMMPSLATVSASSGLLRMTSNLLPKKKKGK